MKRRVKLRSAALLLFWSLLAGALQAFAATSLPSSEQVWWRLDSPHFTLFASDPEVGEDVVLDLEQLREVLSRLVGNDLELTSSAPIYIFLFQDEEAFEPFTRWRSDQPQEALGGFFLSAGVANFVVMRGDLGLEAARQVVYHEYLHFLIDNNFADVPLWFSEGLAEYYSTFRVGRRHVEIGAPIEEHVSRLRLQGLMPLELLFAIDTTSEVYAQHGQRRDLYYAQSWALVHHLLTDGQRRSQAEKYLKRLAQGAPWREAFGDVFEQVTLAQLRDELRLVLDKHRLQGTSVPLTSLASTSLSSTGPSSTVLEPPKVVRRQRMSRPETLYRLGDLLSHLQGAPDVEARAFFEAALELDARHGLANAGLGALEEKALDWARAETLYRRAVELAPGEARPHFLLANLLMRPFTGQRTVLSQLDSGEHARIREARRLYRRALEFQPQLGEAWAGLGASWLLEPEPPAEAGEALSRARRLLPDHPGVAFDLAVLRARQGDFDAAHTLIEQQASRSDRGRQWARDARQAVLWEEARQAEQWLAAGRVDEAVVLLERAAREIQDPEMRRQIQHLLEALEEGGGVRRVGGDLNQAYEEILTTIEQQDYARAEKQLVAFLAQLEAKGDGEASELRSWAELQLEAVQWLLAR